MKKQQASLHLILYNEQLPVFFPFLQEGVTIRALVGCSISSLLVQQFGISPEYIKGRITTLFLNSRAVDDMETAPVRDGSVLALSGAMPGLVGATMRSGGYYAAMRGSISYEPAEEIEVMREGTLRVKLFNLLLPELGPVVLREGILLMGDRLIAFLAGLDDRFWRECRKALLNGQPVDRATLQSGDFISPEELIHLTISFRERLIDGMEN